MFSLSTILQQGQETQATGRASLHKALHEYRGTGEGDLLVILVAIKGWQPLPAATAPLFPLPQSFSTVKLIFVGWHINWKHKTAYH